MVNETQLLIIFLRLTWRTRGWCLKRGGKPLPGSTTLAFQKHQPRFVLNKLIKLSTIIFRPTLTLKQLLQSQQSLFWTKVMSRKPNLPPSPNPSQPVGPGVQDVASDLNLSDGDQSILRLALGPLGLARSILNVICVKNILVSGGFKNTMEKKKNSMRGASFSLFSESSRN